MPNPHPKTDHLTPFKKGKDPRREGNGPKPKLPALDELMAKVMGVMGESGLTAMEGILKAQRAKAEKGDTKSAELLLDRAYGKPKQSTEISNPDGSLNNLSHLTTQELLVRAEAAKIIEQSKKTE